MRWMPILDDADGAASRAIATRALDGALAVEAPLADNPTLILGNAGQALALHYLGRVLDREEEAEPAVVARLERALAQVEQGLFGNGFSLGLAGLACAMHELAPSLPQHDMEDFCAQVDAMVVERCEASETLGVYELQGGLAGEALYALHRWPRPAAQRTIARFLDLVEAAARPRDDAALWINTPGKEPYRAWELEHGAPAIELGMAHGIAGLVVVLNAIADRGIEAPRARRLASGGARLLLEVLASSEAIDGSCVPAVLVGTHAERTGFFAWCKGDAGCGLALSRHDGDADVERSPGQIRALLTAAAARFLDRSDDGERGLCCGDAGRAHIFQRLYLQTDEPIFRAAAREALARTTLPSAKYGEREGYGIISGPLGVALAHAAAISSASPGWAICLGITNETPA